MMPAADTVNLGCTLRAIFVRALFGNFFQIFPMSFISMFRRFYAKKKKGNSVGRSLGPYLIASSVIAATRHRHGTSTLVTYPLSRGTECARSGPYTLTG